MTDVFTAAIIRQPTDKNTRLLLNGFIMKNEKRDFDFNIGHITKSPCNKCEKRFKFPACIDTCIIIGKMQDFLARGVSCSKSTSEA